MPPSIAAIDDMVVSPRCDHVAWKLFARERPWAGLWVSRLDGSDMHEVGGVPITRPLTLTDRLFYDIQWRPDGKYLSFVYEDSLYVIPAE
jgi:hypothetical protein